MNSTEVQLYLQFKKHKTHVNATYYTYDTSEWTRFIGQKYSNTLLHRVYAKQFRYFSV